MSGVCEVWTDFTCGVVLCGVSTVVLSKRGGGAGCQKEVGRPAPLRYLCVALKTVHVDDIDKKMLSDLGELLLLPPKCWVWAELFLMR